MVDDYLLYYLILMTENIELIKSMKFEIDIAINFLKDIIINGIYDSFVYLLENDNSIITTLFDNNRNLLHIIKKNGNFEKIIEKIMEIMPELANISDEFGETPIIYHAKNNSGLLEYFMKYDMDLTVLDKYGNSCLHHLCKHDEPKLLKKFLKKYPELVNMPNLTAEYPIIVCCKSKQEEMFYILKSFNADLSAKDNYGNTAYHYICANSICLGIGIPDVQNYFGLTPMDYCKLSHKYYGKNNI
jgi:ankyrin repeat protein